MAALAASESYLSSWASETNLSFFGLCQALSWCRFKWTQGTARAQHVVRELRFLSKGTKETTSCFLGTEGYHGGRFGLLYCSTAGAMAPIGLGCQKHSKANCEKAVYFKNIHHGYFILCTPCNNLSPVFNAWQAFIFYI